MNTEIPDNIRLSRVNRLLHIDNQWLQSELIEAERTIGKMQAMIDTLAEAANKYTIEHAKRGAVSTATIERLEKALAAVKGKSK